MKILMVCLGNICRSPLAEGILKTKVPDSIFVDSAGTISLHEGKHPDPRAVKTAEAHQIDISEQRSRPVTADDLENFDKIYCMDHDVMADVISKARNEEQRQKISLLMDVPGDHGSAEVPDPYRGGMQEFENVYQILDRECGQIARRLHRPAHRL